MTPHISYQPDSELDVSSWNLPPNTQLADEHFFKSKRIDLLIGTETFFDILSVGQIKLGPNLPTLQKTLFGWIVAGHYNPNHSSSRGSFCMLSIEEEVNFEEINLETNVLWPKQADCESFFKNSFYHEPLSNCPLKSHLMH